VDRRERTVQTVIGVAVTFKRRYYLDVETGQYVFLLDELLGLPKEKQISPALTEVAVMLGVSGPSYRISAEHLEHSHGGKIISHESIRQAVLRAGEAVAAEEASKMREGEGERRVPVLFVEVDGLNVRLQGESRKRVEAKVMVTHEGWRPRHPGSKEYELVNPKFFVAHDGEDFWEEASAHVMRNYKIDKDVTVVINGDRASWTRKGLEYFPKAMYQVDRFHLKRELRTLFGKHSECLARLYEELEMPDPTGARFLACLAECSSKLPSKKRRQEAYNLLQDLASIPGSVVDYRIRLQQEGIDTSSMQIKVIHFGAKRYQVIHFDRPYYPVILELSSTSDNRGQGDDQSGSISAYQRTVCSERAVATRNCPKTWDFSEYGKEILPGRVSTIREINTATQAFCYDPGSRRVHSTVF
jgi:hypothetical protein